jgi:hypothetical protein
VIAGIGGRDVTTVDCMGVGSMFVPDNGQTSVTWTANSILMGLSVINAGDTGINSNNGCLFFRLLIAFE